MAHFRLIRAIFLLFALTALPVHSHAQGQAKRLILKDGSYQLAAKWEVKGDRVRYFSAERSEWEEVPNSLVDWDATNKYEKDRAEGKTSRVAVELEQEVEAERQQDELKSPHVAPGLRLPPEGGVYALDTYLTGPELVPLNQTGGEINRNTARNILRAAINPIGGSKQTVELPGPSSKIQMHAALPTIYINLDAGADEDESSKESAAELPWDRFRMVRAQVKGDKRIVGAIKTAIYGKTSQEQEEVAAIAEQLSGGWIKLTPKTALQPGEYAVAELLGKQGMNSYVWDFGVHPDAPANLAVIKPDASELRKPVDESRELKKRD